MTTPADRPVPTPEQTRPLEVRGASVALSAGAGCGKTSVLTRRFLTAIDPDLDEERPLGTIVALTFTEKAARELRQRVRAACRARLSGAGPAEARFWRVSLRGLEAAPISTFHEYCAGMLRRHALDAGLDPEFEVLDETLAGAVREEAVDARVRRWLAEPNSAEGADLIELAVEYGPAHVREALADLVGGRDAHHLEAWARHTPESLVHHWRAVWAERGRPLVLRALTDAADHCEGWLIATDFDHPKLVGFRDELLVRLDGPEGRTDDEGWLESLRAAAYLPKGLRQAHWPSPEVNTAAKEITAELRAAIDAWRAASAIDEGATLRAAAMGLRFARLAARARAEYDERKARRGGLDFDDLLVRALDLLEAHPAEVRDDPGRPVRFILVDEFQDTDPVQSAVLRRLSDTEFAQGRLFVVGDFKQSIYRFRGARPALFREYRAEFPERGRLDLSQNFRSAAPVLDFVNALFHEAIEGETVPLRPGPESRPASDRPAVAFVWPVEAPEGNRKASDHELRRTEARWLARLVRSRLEAGWPVRVRGGGPGAIRNAHAGDVAFLFRAMTDVAHYEQALAAEGLDYHVVGGSAFYAQQEVQDLVNVLSVIEDPCDAVALAGALRGPFFGLSDDGLYQLGGAGRGDLAARFGSGEPSAGLSADDAPRLERARALFDGWRSLKDRLPIAGLIDRVLLDSGYEAALPGEFLGDRKRANARKLVRLARRFDARGGFTLAHVVARFRADLREPPKEGQAATTDEEGTSVRLMSIHQSKGLEFPIVVLPDLNRKPGGARGAIQFDAELGPLVRSARAADESEGDGPESAGGEAGESLGWLTHRTLDRPEAEAESLRLFYVATTRARDALVLSAGGGLEKKPGSQAMKLLAGRFDRRTGACLAGLPDGWDLPSIEVVEECPPPAAPAPRRRPRRASPGAVARVIRSAVRQAGSSPEPTPPRPWLVDLDDLEACGSSPRAARLARLIRSAVCDPRATRPGGLAAAVPRAARRQVPAASAELVDEARRRLGPWLDETLRERLAGSSRLRRGVASSLVWPGGEGLPPVVAQGRVEFLVRDADGVWSVLILSPPGAAEALERLRWVVGARAAVDRGLAPMGPGWRLDLGDGGGPRREPACDDRAVNEALEAALRHLADPGRVDPCFR